MTIFNYKQLNLEVHQWIFQNKNCQCVEIKSPSAISETVYESAKFNNLNCILLFICSPVYVPGDGI